MNHIEEKHVQDAHSEPFLMPKCEVSYYPKTDTIIFRFLVFMYSNED